MSNGHCEAIRKNLRGILRVAHGEDGWLGSDLFFTDIEDHADEMERDQDNLKACVEELADAWVPDEWRGRDGWRVRNVLEKHNVLHLFPSNEGESS